MAPPNELFQYSVVSALMDGVAGSGLPLAELLSHGDHGLGTFRHMVGEMIILDGAIYQMRSDGSHRNQPAGIQAARCTSARHSTCRRSSEPKPCTSKKPASAA